MRAVLSWTALTALGGIWCYFKEVHFAPEPEIVPYALGLALLCGLLCCLLFFLDPDPRNRFASKPILLRTGLFLGLLVAFSALAWGTLNYVAGPFVTSFFGTQRTGTYVVTEKSSGRADRRSCNHFVWLREKHSKWLVKVCLGKEVWGTVQAGDELRGAGRGSFLGRTLEHVDWRSPGAGPGVTP